MRCRVSFSDINLSNVPILHGLVSVKGLNGKIATVEKWAEKRNCTEKAVCARASESHCCYATAGKLVTPRG